MTPVAVSHPPLPRDHDEMPTCRCGVHWYANETSTKRETRTYNMLRFEVRGSGNYGPGQEGRCPAPRASAAARRPHSAPRHERDLAAGATSTPATPPCPQPTSQGGPRAAAVLPAPGGNRHSCTASQCESSAGAASDGPPLSVGGFHTNRSWSSTAHSSLW
eukprot:5476076-Prymnesium_polylepis.2